ncbi:MAG: hypothetical protein ACK4MF_05575 [Hyphomicrobiaceae bacterium]
MGWRVGRQRDRTVLIAALLGVLALALLGGQSADAGWLSRITREAGDAGASLRHGLAGDDLAGALGRQLKTLPSGEAKAMALAAHATPEGHWRFANRDGEVFTSASAAEMQRAFATLLPEPVSAGPGKLRLYLSEETVFHRAEAIAELPETSDLYLLTAQGSAFRLISAPSSRLGYAAAVRPHVRVNLTDRAVFDETVWQLGRPLNRANIRVIALQPGARHTLSSVPLRGAGSNAAMVDAIDPLKLAAALRSIKGQTIVVSGRADGRLLHFKSAGSGDTAIDLDELKRAARDADVDLVVMHGASAVQPGSRNWLWQSVGVKGLSDALGKGDFGDFLEALAVNRGGLQIDAGAGLQGRTALDIRSLDATSRPVGSVIGEWAGGIVENVLGNVVVEAIKVDAVDRERRRELDLRLIPGVPSYLQGLYLAAIILGLIGYRYAGAWWRRIWPQEERGEYAGALGYHAARLVRMTAFVVLFLPIVGLPAGVWTLIVSTLQQLWAILTAPYHLLRWIYAKLRPVPG